MLGKTYSGMNYRTDHYESKVNESSVYGEYSVFKHKHILNKVRYQSLTENVSKDWQYPNPTFPLGTMVTNLLIWYLWQLYISTMNNKNQLYFVKKTLERKKMEQQT